MYPCRRKSSETDRPDVSIIVGTLDACATSPLGGADTAYIGSDVVVYCATEEFTAAQELPDYVAADYSAPPLFCNGPDCVDLEPQYEYYLWYLYAARIGLEDADSRYQVPGEDLLPGLFSGEIGVQSFHHVIHLDYDQMWSVHLRSCQDAYVAAIMQLRCALVPWPIAIAHRTITQLWD